MEKKPPIEISLLLALMFFISLYTLVSSTFTDGTIVSILMINSIIIVRLFLVTSKTPKVVENDNDFEKVAKNLIENGSITYKVESENKNILLLKDVSNAFSEKISTLKIFAKSLKDALNIKNDAIELKNNNVKIDGELSNLSTSSSTMTNFSDKVTGFENILGSSIGLNDQIASSSVEISQAVDSLYASIDEVSAIVEETSLSIETITTNSEKLLSSTEETSAAMIELSSNARQSVSNAQEASNVALQMKSAAQEGNKSVQESVQGIKSLSETVIKAADVIENLGKNTQKIGDIVNVIREIAEQTNLLALNAAIEAARAGEHGRGFAVVADEVRKLAERSSLSTKEISALIKGIQTETLDAIEVVRGGTLGAEKATKLAQEAGQKINQFLDGVEYTAQLVEKIASSSIDQSGVSDIVAESISQMNTQVVQVSDAIKEQSIGVKHIVEALTEVKGMISQVQSSVYLQVNSSKLINEVNGKAKSLVTSLSTSLDESSQLSNNISKTLSSLTSINSINKEKADNIMKNLETTTEALNVILEELDKFKTENNKSLIQL